MPPAKAVGAPHSHCQVRVDREASGTPIDQETLVARTYQDRTRRRLPIGAASLDAGGSRADLLPARLVDAGSYRPHAQEDAIRGRYLALFAAKIRRPRSYLARGLSIGYQLRGIPGCPATFSVGRDDRDRSIGRDSPRSDRVRFRIGIARSSFGSDHGRPSPSGLPASPGGGRIVRGQPSRPRSSRAFQSVCLGEGRRSLRCRRLDNGGDRSPGPVLRAGLDGLLDLLEVQDWQPHHLCRKGGGLQGRTPRRNATGVLESRLSEAPRNLS